MRRRGLGGGGSGRRRRGFPSGRRREEDDAPEEGGDDEGGSEEEDAGGDDDDADEDEKPRRSSRRRGRRSSGDDDDDGDDSGGFDQRRAAEAEKQKQMMIVIGVGIGLVLLIVLGLAISGGSEHQATDDDATKTAAPIKKVDVDVEDVRKLIREGQQDLVEAEGLEGARKRSKLEEALRTLESARDLANNKRAQVPNPAAQGPSFDILSAMVDNELNPKLISARKLVLEARASSE